MTDSHYFANLWYPDFRGISYLTDTSGILFAPYFLEREKALYVSKKIEEWNEKFVTVTFITLKDGTYEFVCYEQPMAAKDPLLFGLYRSSMEQNGFFSKFKPRFQEEPRLQIVYIKNIDNPSDLEPIGSSIKINKVEIVSEDDLPSTDDLGGISFDAPYYWESIAHRLLNKDPL